MILLFELHCLKYWFNVNNHNCLFYSKNVFVFYTTNGGWGQKLWNSKLTEKNDKLLCPIVQATSGSWTSVQCISRTRLCKNFGSFCLIPLFPLITPQFEQTHLLLLTLLCQWRRKKPHIFCVKVHREYWRDQEFTPLFAVCAWRYFGERSLLHLRQQFLRCSRMLCVTIVFVHVRCGY